MTWKSKKKIRELLAGEEGTVLKDFGNPIRIAVVFPNIYNVGMSNLGVHHIYRMLNSLRGVLCERVFLPDEGEEEILSIESQRPLSDFSALLFTIPFENDIKNIEKILKNVEPMPFLAIGGAIPRLLPDFFRKRFDIVSELDAEEGLLEILSKLGYEEKVKFEKKPARTAIWTENTEFGSMHLVEVQRGCPNHCLFCAAPVVYSPLIQFSKKDIIEAIDEGLPHRKKIGLIGGDILAHPDFIEIVEHIHGRGATFSPSSLRADRITDQIARLLNDSGHKTITLAPETGSEILRKRIGKNIKDEAFFQARDLLMSNGVAQFKLYFMIGLPGESDEELLEIANFVTRFRLKEIKRLTLTINSFVPKRKTPFSTQKLIEPADYRRKVGLLKKALHKIGGISFKIEPYSTATREFEFHNL